jgi:hypothetical protein
MSLFQTKLPSNEVIRQVTNTVVITHPSRLATCNLSCHAAAAAAAGAAAHSTACATPSTTAIATGVAHMSLRPPNMTQWYTKPATQTRWLITRRCKLAGCGSRLLQLLLLLLPLLIQPPQPPLQQQRPKRVRHTSRVTLRPYINRETDSGNTLDGNSTPVHVSWP